MKIIRNIIVSFSMYSRIPMPHFEWKEEDTKYAIGFIGLIGLVIAAIEYLFVNLGEYLSAPVLVRSLLFAVIPLIITGGFHVDGFMDVSDALNSYKSREEKIKILKDPHIGAFAVISLAIYGCLFLAFTYILFNSYNKKLLGICCVGFVLLRAIGAFIAVTFKHSKNEGMLHSETENTDIFTKIILAFTAVCSVSLMMYFDLLTTVILMIATIVFILYFKVKCYKEFGGVSGDTIGYFITVGELIVIIVTSVLTYL